MLNEKVVSFKNQKGDFMYMCMYVCMFVCVHWSLVFYKLKLLAAAQEQQ